MIIGIDGNEANVKTRVGVNMYAFELLWSIWKLQKEWSNKHKLIVYLKDAPLPDIPPATDFFKYKILSGGKLWIITRLMPYLLFAKEKPDIFFSPSHYVPLLATMPRVSAIMDLGYLKFSGQFKKFTFWQLKYWSAYSIFVSKAIISISNTTKDDIVRHYPLVKNKIYVTSLAYDPKRFNTHISSNDVRRIRKTYSIVGDYLLYIGTLKPSKNIEGILEAYKLVRDHIPNIKLVIAGKKGWMYDKIFEKVKKLNLEEQVIFTDYLPEEDKPSLISGAKVFILPSFWEGFGLDVLSAMACGVPVVVSDRGSLPEIVGDAGILVNPDNPQDITRGIEKVLSMSEIEYNMLRERGLKQTQKFSWEKTAKETLKIFEEVVKK